MKRPAPASREAGLLCLCARGRADSAAIRNLAAQAIDWPVFLKLAESHRLAPLCFRRLQDACPELVPPDIRAALEKAFRRSVERNLFFAGELSRIFTRLDAAGVAAFAFKGPVLAWWLYDHPGVRESSDLDLLVDAQDLTRTCTQLASLGYHVDRTGPLRSEGQVSLFRYAPEVTVDLHWELAPASMGLRFDARSVASQSAEVLVAGRSVHTFGIEDQILSCALHGGKHGWTRLAWLADLSALIELRPPDWPRLIAEARRKRLTRALFLGLRLAHNLLGTPLPAEIAALIPRDAAAASLARETAAHLFGPSRARRLFPRELRYEWSLTEGCAGKARFLWSKLTELSPADAQSAASTRPFRLMWKYVHRLAALR